MRSALRSSALSLILLSSPTFSSVASAQTSLVTAGSRSVIESPTPFRFQLSPIDPTDIRSIAPPKPIPSTLMIAVPDSGSDLSSVGSSWAGQEFHLVTNGADQKFLDGANAKLDRWFNSTDEESAGSADISREVSSARAPAGSPASLVTSAGWLQKPSVRMSRLGEIEFGLGPDRRTKLSCDLSGGGGGEWNLSKPLRGDLDVRLHHEMDTNSLQLRLNW